MSAAKFFDNNCIENPVNRVVSKYIGTVSF
eukprot:SAG31_NODE_22246_length_530_cov_1.078886_1_plen_29_part_10